MKLKEIFTLIAELKECESADDALLFYDELESIYDLRFDQSELDEFIYDEETEEFEFVYMSYDRCSHGYEYETQFIYIDELLQKAEDYIDIDLFKDAAKKMYEFNELYDKNYKKIDEYIENEERKHYKRGNMYIELNLEETDEDGISFDISMSYCGCCGPEKEGMHKLSWEKFQYLCAQE